MGRPWQFFLTVAVVCGTMAAFYYSSDFYTQRAGAEAADGVSSLIPSNE